MFILAYKIVIDSRNSVWQMNIPISWFRLTKPREIYEGSLSEELHRLKIRFNCKLSRTMAGNCTWGGSNDYVGSIIKLWKSIVITKIDFRASSVGDGNSSKARFVIQAKGGWSVRSPHLFKLVFAGSIPSRFSFFFASSRIKNIVPSILLFDN